LVEPVEWHQGFGPGEVDRRGVVDFHVLAQPAVVPVQLGQLLFSSVVKASEG